MLSREDFPLLMPNSKPILPETYLCTTLRLDENNTYYIGQLMIPEQRSVDKKEISEMKGSSIYPQI